MERLFSTYDLYSVGENTLRQAKQKADDITEQQLKNRTNDEIVSDIVASLRMKVCEVSWDDAAVSREEAMVDLMNVPNTMASYQQRSVLKAGEKFVICVPVSGDLDFLRIRPSTWSSSMPMATISRRELKFEYSGLQVDVARSKADFESNKSEIKSYLDRLRGEAEAYNLRLEGIVKPVIEVKRARMQAGEANITGFGLPIR